MIGRSESTSNQHTMMVSEQGLSLFQPQPPISSPSSILTDSRKRNNVYLPEGYLPGPCDVICQRGKDCNEHVGNRRFRVVVDKFVDSYLLAQSRQEKSVVISNIVKVINDYAGDSSISSSSSILQSHHGHQGGFIMKDSRSHQWHHVDNKVARDKVGNALREAVKQREESAAGIPGAVHSNDTTTPTQTMPWIGRKSDCHSSPLEAKLGLLLTKYRTNDGVVSNIHLSRNMYGKAVDDTLMSQPSTLKKEAGCFDVTSSASANHTFSSPSEQPMQGRPFHESYHHQSCPIIHNSCFEMDCSELMTDDEHNHHATHFSYPLFPLEALAQSMNIDDLTADLEPRPIENMLQR